MSLVKLLLIFAITYLVVRWWRGARPAARPRPAAPPPSEASGSPSAYEILGVSRQASQAEIHTAYQRLIRQYHPDRVADMGPEIRAVAEQKAKEINGAYEALRRG